MRLMADLGPSIGNISRGLKATPNGLPERPLVAHNAKVRWQAPRCRRGPTLS